MADVLQAARAVLDEHDRGELFGRGKQGECLVLIARGVLALMEDGTELVLRAEKEADRMRPVYEASLALRRSESRAALASEMIAEIEEERALTDQECETRTKRALVRWRSAVDAALEES